MNYETLCYAFVMLTGVFISTLAQVLLKKSAMREYPSKIREYLNPFVISAGIILFVASLLSVYAYKRVPLSLGPVLEATSYIYVTVFGFFVFKEKMSERKWIALGMIILGIIICSV